MSKTPEQEGKDAKDEVLYFEAELASLKEELEHLALYNPASVNPSLLREKFVELRIARIEKQLPDLRERAGKAEINARWLANVNHPKRG